jgi:hypothetical protein
MLPGPTLEIITDNLRSYFTADAHAQVKLVGIVFCRPESALMAEILPSTHQYHLSSGNHCNFYFAGYHETDEQSSDDVVVSPGKGRNQWAFNYHSFNELVRAVEANAEWEYSGGADLLLTNAVSPRPRHPEILDWDSTLPMNLDEMKHMGAITNCDLFFQQIFQYAQRSDSLDPTWGFSDAMGKRAAGSVLWGLVLSVLPDAVRKQISNARFFARHGRRLKVRRRR